MPTTPPPTGINTPQTPKHTQARDEVRTYTQSTPITQNELGTQPFTSTHHFYNAAFSRAANEMTGKFQEMDGDEFLETFFPERPGLPKLPDATRCLAEFGEIVSATKGEMAIYDPFVRLCSLLNDMPVQFLLRLKP